ncbi:glycerophosphodiester phosphodiesterase [Flavobacteriaceae bacterium F89]|uniref:Glycerophosphodiester phosphodiesterase n=1 Tax=Cerina litoralis TaxID=2874477 RepID=A0AAE3JSL3_9FLAO|nr:glycerophosphodiester phosphodiesterase family protein [Cerina litoralis]MCG2460652.1 glycerophosphodiester phosphodiesterase [Cerina litoralis]
MIRFVLTCCIALFFTAFITPDKKMDFSDNVVIAHRGAWKKNSLPENSIASLKQAIALKCTGSEFDVRMTVDDSLIINHDAHFQNLPIEETRYADLEVHKLSNGEKLPTLREYLLAGMKNNTSTRLICEIKPSETSPERGQEIAEKVYRLVEEVGASKMVVYISFDYEMLKRLIDLDPTVRTQYLRGDVAPDRLKADGMTGLDYHYSVFKKQPEWIDEAKRNHLVLNAWTVDKVDDMKWLLDKGFDQITTNEPELLLKITEK